MNVGLRLALNDHVLDATRASSQRQLAIFVSALIPEVEGGQHDVPLNLCLILDHSGSMSGRPLQTVKEAAQSIVDRLNERDRLAIVAFDHHAKVLVSNQRVEDPEAIKAQIQRLEPKGGTAIDAGMKLGIAELAEGKQGAVSQALLLTDGENEHGDDDRCLKFATLATEYNMTLNTLGFGSHWNEDLLERIADTGGGSLTLIEKPENAIDAFNQLLTRIESVGLTNAHLQITLSPGVRLANLKPLAQVTPETIELTVEQEGDYYVSRLGDLMTISERTILANLYIDPLPLGCHTIGTVQVRYDHPACNQVNLLSETIPIEMTVTDAYQPQVNPEVQQHILALAKYRQTQIAETKLQQGDRSGAATMLQMAAKTALQMGDRGAATVLQSNATRLEAGQDLSEGERKKTRIVSKTMLQ
jgi:Ca-activated chloride channel family protein